MHAVSDETIPHSGVADGLFSHLSQEELLRVLRESNGCEEEPIRTELLDDPPLGRGSFVCTFRTPTGEEHVVHYALASGGHRWQWGDLSTATLLVEFFSHPR